MAAGNLLSSVFGRSPISRIKEHSAKSYECAKELPPFFETVFANDWKKAKKLQLSIKKLEEDADEIKRAIHLSLPKSLFLPIPRVDLLKIVTAQDKIPNCCKDIAGLIISRKIQFPLPMQEELLHYLQRSIDSSEQAFFAMNTMDALIETVFKGPKAHLIGDLVHNIDYIESDTDAIQIKVREKLFSLEKDLHPVDVMFLYQIIERIGELADRAHNVGNYLELMLAH